MSRIDDPASAVAASLCLLARRLDERGITPRHPRPCDWCVWPIAVLVEMVEAFNAAAGYDPRRGTYANDRHDVRVFGSAPRADQVAQVTAAQGLEPMDIAAAAPVDEEDLPWLR
jgi:hypothetical protein